MLCYSAISLQSVREQIETVFISVGVHRLHQEWYLLKLQTKVNTKVRNHGEGPYQGLLLVESAYYRFHI